MVSRRAIRRRPRIAEDPEYRKKRRRPHDRRYREAHKDEIAARHRQRFAEDPEYRKRKSASDRRYRETHKDELNERRRQKRRTDPKFREREREYRVRRYGMSLDDRHALSVRQGGVCAICRIKPRRPLELDHCHSTGKVRGLLCNPCNIGLGLYHDDPDRLLTAVAYLLASRHDINPADLNVVAAEIAQRLCQRLEVLLREQFALRHGS